MVRVAYLLPGSCCAQQILTSSLAIILVTIRRFDGSPFDPIAAKISRLEGSQTKYECPRSLDLQYMLGMLRIQ